MARDERLSRRRMLELTGIASSTAFVAGCGGGPGNGDTGENDSDGGTETAENETGGNGENGSDGGNETADNETAENETDGDGGGTDGFEISPDQDIRFSGQTTHWEGLQPSEIEGEENPTLVLEADETYSIGWTEGDGAAHNLELRNASGDVVDDYTTGDPVADPGSDETFEFTATTEIARYRCLPHPQMEGDIRIQGGGGGTETSGNESDGNQTDSNETGGNETGDN